jgi:capsular polysaccharide transport system permease protein
MLLKRIDAAQEITDETGAPLRERWRSVNVLFLITVILPTLAALVYFSMAADVYISQSRFVVRSPDKPSTTGLGLILKTAGFSNAGDEVYAAQSFVLSPDALRAINHDNAFRKAYTRPAISIFDRFNPLGFTGSFEDLYRYYTGKVRVEHDPTSAITELTVRAYTPQDALRFNNRLLELAEATVNRLNVRGRQDLIRYAENEVQSAKDSSRQAAVRLARFRNAQGVVDPDQQAKVQLQMVSKLQDELIASRSQLMQLRAYAPRNPQVPVLQTKIQSLSHAINVELGKVTGGDRSLAQTTVQFQRLQLESVTADKQLAAAIASLEEARNEAQRKQAYVERIVDPELPDAPLEPRRFRGILATFIFGLIAYGIGSMLLAGMREHQN